MKTNEVTPIGETAIERLIEHVRRSYSRSLNWYFQVCKEYAQVKQSTFDSNRKKVFSETDKLFYDGEGKINWNNIRQMMPLKIEELLKEKYSMLNDNEIHLCCLLAFDISPKKIAAIMLYKKASIPSIKYLIKQKSGIKDFTDLFREITLNHFLNANR